MTTSRFPLSTDRFAAPSRDPWTMALILVSVVATVLRFWKLGDWSFAADEGFTIEFSTDQFTWADQRPLAFALNHYLTIPLFGVNEFSLRLIPALAGAISVPVVGWMVGRVYGRVAGFFAALALAVSPWLLYHAQFARYYAQSFLCAAIVPFAVRFWLAGDGARWLVLAMAGAVVGWFVVPSSVFILPGVFLWIAWNYRDVGSARLLMWIRRYALPLVAAGAVLAVSGGFLVYRVYQYSQEMLAAGRYASLPGIALTTVSGLTVPMTLLAAVGFLACWGDRDRSRMDRTFLPLVAVGALAVYPLVYPISAVGAFHVVSVLSVVFALMGTGAAAIWHRMADPRLRVAVTAAFFLSAARPVASYYVDGNRVDYRTAASAVETLVASDPGPIYAIAHGLIEYYAPDLEVHEYKQWAGDDPFPWRNAAGFEGPIWVVLPEYRKGVALAGGGTVPPDALSACTLMRWIGRQRLDYHENAMRIYRCGGAVNPS